MNRTAEELAELYLKEKAERAQRRARYKSALEASSGHPNHGKYRGYAYGCRCDKCKKAYSDYRKEHRKGKSC